ncbi:MAG: hypothetical protein ACLFUH_07485 [Bacteroidales bacterium]
MDKENIDLILKGTMWAIFIIMIIVVALWTVNTIEMKKQLSEIWARDIDRCTTWNCTVEGMGNLKCNKMNVNNFFNTNEINISEVNTTTVT